VTIDTFAQPPGPRVSGTVVLDQSWHATPNNVTRSRRLLLERLRVAEPSDVIADAIGASVTEATTNVVYHAYVGRRIGQFRITARVLSDEISITIEDDGCGFDEAATPAGSGRPLITALTDRVETSRPPRGGTRTAMSFLRDR
jgi:anti-sigma regulatory factor (Ser/Thr protein kinase)